MQIKKISLQNDKDMLSVKQIHFLSFLSKILLFLVFFLIAFIIAGTVLAFFRPPLEANTHPQIENSPYFLRDGKAIYSELKQIRVISKDSTSATIVLQPYLEYDGANIPLQEEIVKKKEIIKKIIIDWFSDKTWLQIESKKESEIKALLLEELNKVLTLGKISAIYFKEFRIVH